MFSSVFWMLATKPEIGSNLRVVEAFLGETELFLEIADTPEKMFQGLSGRKSLPEGRGMLFVFAGPAFYSFVMRDMNFSIDIVWFDENFRVIDVKENALPESYPSETFSSRTPAMYVLEVRAGFFRDHNLAPGHRLILKEDL